MRLKAVQLGSKTNLLNRTKRKHTGIIMFSCIVPLILCIVTLVFLIAFRNTNSAEGSLLTSGLAIIAIAVSVWIGLNIYNVVSKQDIEDALDIMNKIDVLFYKNAFLNELEKTGLAYELSGYLYERFRSREFDDTGIPYEELLEIERVYVEFCNAYEKNKWNVSGTIAESIIHQVIYLKKNTKRIMEQNKVYLIYVESRLGDMYYYKNIALPRENGTSMNYNEMEITIECFRRIDAAIEAGRENGASVAYVYNTIGYTRHNIKGSDEQEALDNMIKAVKANPKRATYHRNLGLVYQGGYESGVVKLREGNRILSQEECYEKAKKEYETGIKCDPQNNKGYNNVGALILKGLDQRFNIDSNRTRTISELFFGIKDDDKVGANQEIDESIQYLTMAYQADFSFEDVSYNLGKAYMYKYLVNMSDNSNEAVKYLNRGKAVTERVALMNPENIGYRFVLRNIYEAEGNIKKAQEINETLNNIGDSKKIGELYTQILNN